MNLKKKKSYSILSPNESDSPSMPHLYFFLLVFPLCHSSLELSSFFFKRNSIPLSLLLSLVQLPII